MLDPAEFLTFLQTVPKNREGDMFNKWHETRRGGGGGERRKTEKVLSRLAYVHISES